MKYGMRPAALAPAVASCSPVIMLPPRMPPIGTKMMSKRIMKKEDAFSLAKKHERKHENEFNAIPCRK